MSELAVKTPKPSSIVHKSKGDSEKNSPNGNDLFIQPKEGFSQHSFIQPSVVPDVKTEDAQTQSEEVESKEKETVDTHSETKTTSEQGDSGENKKGLQKGFFGEPAFFQPQARLKNGIKKGASSPKEEIESTKELAIEKVSESSKTNALSEQGKKSPLPLVASQSLKEKVEVAEKEEGQKEEGEQQEQTGSEKVEDVPTETELKDASPEELANAPKDQEVQEEMPAEEGAASEEEKKDAKNAAFENVVSKIKGTSEEQKQHDPPEQLSGEAQDAALSPPNERTSQAQASVVDEMEAEAQEPKEFSAEEFKAKLMKRINEMDMPKNLEEADEFKDNNKLDDVNKAALGDVQQQKEATVGNVDQATNQAPNPDAVPPKEVTPLRQVPVGPKPKSVNANKAVPDKRPDAEVKTPVEENTKRLDDTMAENDVTDQQLAISEEPKFEKALESKGVAKENAKTAPVELRQKEQTTLNTNAQKAEGTSQEQLEAMNQLRGSAINKVVGGQQQTATKDTSERERIASEINTIYEDTKKDVNKILEDLDTKVTTMFEKASTDAKNKFEAYCAIKMAAYKAKRYSGVLGKGRWLKDLVMSLPEEVNQFYVDGRELFKKVMEIHITKIATVVAQKLNEAKQRVETGKQKVTEYVDSLPANLKSIGKEAADDIQDKFNELSDDVNATQDDLIDTLATEYQASLDEVDARIEEMKEANKGLVDKAMDMVNGVIETIKKLKQVISDLLSAISSVIPVIIAAPIEFMGNLFSGIGKGIDLFKANIQKHLMGGLLEWLTGSLGPLGIQMPDDIFSLKGIFSLVMQVLGLGWDYLRVKAVMMMGEPVVKALESGWDMFKRFSKDGIMGMWEYMKEKFSDLKETVMDAIKDMLITKVIEAGIKWLVSLLIPGAGFIKAIMAIKDVIVFFVESAIMLIPAITEAILALAAGSIAGVAKAIEFGLAKLIPLVIGLFAKLIGLGGLTKKVKKIFKKVRKRVDRAVMKLLKKARKAGRKLMRKLGIGGKEKPKNKEQHDTQVKAGLQYLHSLEKKYDTDGNKKISEEEAQKIARKTKKKFKVFTSITPKEKGGKWVYEWRGSSGEEHGYGTENGGEVFDGYMLQPTEVSNQSSMSITEKRNDKAAVGYKAKKKSSSSEKYDGIIVGLSKTKYVESLKGKESDVYNKLDKLPYSERKKAIGSAPSHKKFKPIQTAKPKIEGDETTIYYGYEGSSVKFTVTFNNKTNETSNVSAKNLSFHGFGRGETKGETKAGMNRAHIVANEVRGTGYIEGHNLMLTSERFNKTVMRRTESDIATYLNEQGDDYGGTSKFDMDVTVTRYEVDEELPKTVMREALTERRNELKNVVDKMNEEEKETSSRFAEYSTLDTLLKMSNDAIAEKLMKGAKKSGERRVKQVKYLITRIIFQNGDDYEPMKDFYTGPDFFHGTN